MHPWVRSGRMYGDRCAAVPRLAVSPAANGGPARAAAYASLVRPWMAGPKTPVITIDPLIVDGYEPISQRAVEPCWRAPSAPFTNSLSLTRAHLLIRGRRAYSCSRALGEGVPGRAGDPGTAAGHRADEVGGVEVVSRPPGCGQGAASLRPTAAACVPRLPDGRT
jgi:hypothetical protein